MKHGFRRLAAFGLALLMILPALTAGANAPSKSVTVLFTHDMHDHVYPDAGGMGGWVRLATALKEERAAAEAPTFTLDAGDFSMGSLFQTAYATDAPELRLMGQMGFDATTLGNHEFDYRQQGLADMLNAAKASGETLPLLVQANYTTPKDTEAGAELADAVENYPITPAAVLERDGVCLGVFGIMGKNSDEYAPMSGMILEDPVSAAQNAVNELQDRGVDFIVCLSHSGTEKGKGEDYDLAKKVKGIDLIISGHTHTTLEEPIQVGDTFLVSAGEYTRNLGRITLSKKVSETAVHASEYRLRPIDSSVPADPELAASAEKFKAAVETGYLAQYGLGYDEVLANVKGENFTIEQTGGTIGKAYISAVRELEGMAYQPVAFAVAPDGVIRDILRQGDVTTAQAFDVLSLGSGADGSPGYPLISVYLTGEDLKNAFEVDASISPFMPVAALYGAGVSWIYNPHRMILDRVTGWGVTDAADGKVTDLPDDKRLYRVVADLYSGQMLGAVRAQSFGLLAVTPRDENGVPVTDLESRILKRPDGSEVKAWHAFASYLRETGEIEAPVPVKLSQPSWKPIDLLRHPGASTTIVLLVALVLLAVVILAITLAVLRRGRRGGNGCFYRPYRGR